MRVVVPASQFASMNWVSDLGMRAVVSAGQGAKDHARAAIQHSSRRAVYRRVYTHTGWRKVDGSWVYLTGDGGIDAGGITNGFDVQLDGQLARFSLPAPLVEDALCVAVLASIDLLELGPDHVMVPILGAVYRSVLGAANFGLHVFGQTGVGKTQIAASDTFSVAERASYY